jgi:hypothetical protein
VRAAGAAKGDLRRLDPAVLAEARKFAATRMSTGPILAALRKVVSARVIRDRLDRMFNQVLLTSGSANPEFKSWFNGIVENSPAVASQGIVLGGTAADEIRIQSNTIAGVLQGIHLGVSHGVPKGTRGGRRKPGAVTRDTAGSAWVVSNTVNVVLPVDWRGERHGIFAGNVTSLVIDGNRLHVTRFGNEDPIDGIRVWGALGPRVLVENNHVDSFTRSIWVHPVNPSAGERSLWLVSRNLCARSSIRVVPEPGVRATDLNIG